MSSQIFKKIAAAEVSIARGECIDQQTMAVAKEIVAAIRQEGSLALKRYAKQFDAVDDEIQFVYTQADLKAAFDAISEENRQLLTRTAKRIADFAKAQKEAVKGVEVAIPGGFCGHKIAPLERAGCYAPGGRFPLPSSVLMTAVTARIAGVKEVWLASPRPTQITLAAAHVAGADALLAVGGAQAIAALAYGVKDLNIPAANIIVGPGNRYVTAAKKLVSGDVAIDMLAGPSELLAVIDKTSNLEFVAADILAQAEHDTDALPIVVSLSSDLYQPLCAELERQLEGLSTKETAGEALKNGFFVAVGSKAEAISLCNKLAPEHLQLMLADAESYVSELKNYGGLFIGQNTAEVFGDYGIGPNHVLPTSGTAHYTAGLSVFNFLRFQTWIRIDDAAKSTVLAEDSAALAELEGLAGHTKAAKIRLKNLI